MKTLVLLAVGLTVVSCVHDDDMCGDNMQVYSDPMFGPNKFCMLKESNDSETTPVPQPDDTESEIADAGDVDGGEDTGNDDSDGVGGDGETCTETSDCPDGQYCDPSLDPPSCRLPPTGEGTACESDADCAGFEADYCEAFLSFTCLVQNCDASNINSCSPDYICCDFAWMGMPSMCVNSELSGGVCYEP